MTNKEFKKLKDDLWLAANKKLRDSFVFETEEKITDSGLKNSSAKIFPGNTLIMAMYGVNIGQLGISVHPSAANQACCVFTNRNSEERLLYYSFFFFKAIRTHLFNICMRAAQKNLSQDIIKRLDFIKPHSDLLISFDKFQKPLFEHILKLKQMNMILKQTRDLLLPRLISGKLKAKEIKEVQPSEA